MNDMPEYAPRSTYRMCESLSDTVLDLLVDALLMEANLTESGQLDRQDITNIARDFKKKHKNDYQRKLQKIAEKWLTQVEKDHWSQSRKRPFERIVVRRFSHLFPPAEPLEDKHAVSRRALIGLFLAFEQLAGHEFMEQCQGAGRRIYKNVSDDRGEDFKWDDYYDEPTANDLTDDLMAVIAWSFTDINLRLQWLLNLINTHLTPPEDYAFEGEAVFNWTLKEEGLIEILRSLFADFRTNLANEDSRRQIDLRYGQKAVLAIEEVVRQLDDMG